MGTYGGAAAVKEKPGAQNSAKSSRSSASASTQSSQSRDRGNGYSYTSQDRVDDEPVESFSDLFADIWKEVAMNKGSSLLEEALEFLESQVCYHVIIVYPKAICNAIEPHDNNIIID